MTPRPPTDPLGAIQQLVKRLHRVEALLSGVAVRAQEDWRIVGAAGEPAFQNAWVNEGSGTYYGAQFMVDAFGRVHLRGAIKDGAIGAAAFTLPVGYRPSQSLELPVVSYTGAAYNADSSVTILPDFGANAGQVRPARGNTTIFWLDGISFAVP